MSNIFLAPDGRSTEATRKNFESTVLGGRSYNLIEPFLDQKEKEILSKYEWLKMWGVIEKRPGSTWLRMQSGDFVLFYEKKRFCYAAEVIVTKHSQELSEKLWSTWEYPCIFFLDNLREINIPCEVINQLAKYNPNYYLGTFIPLNNRGLEAIKEKFGSIENFINRYTTSLKAEKTVPSLFAKVYYFFCNYFK